MGPPKRGFTNTSDRGFSLLKLKPGNRKVLNNAMVNKHCNVPLPKELDRISQFLECWSRMNNTLIKLWEGIWIIRHKICPSLGGGKNVQQKELRDEGAHAHHTRPDIEPFCQVRHSLCFRSLLTNEKISEQGELCHITLNLTASHCVTLFGKCDALCQMCDNKAHYRYSFPFSVIYFKC